MRRTHEAAGMAQGAGIRPEDILMLNALPAGFYPPSRHNCTTFVEIGRKERCPWPPIFIFFAAGFLV